MLISTHEVSTELHRSKVDIITALRDLAGQEGNDSQEYDLMMEAAAYIQFLRRQADRKGSGRTRRMLREAIKLDAEGRAVYVLAATKPHADYLQNTLAFMGYTGASIKIEPVACLPNLDWRRMQLTGAHPNTVLLADHYAVERYFSAALKEMHAYDEGEDDDK